ncbi:MAG: superoxide dismutase [Actinobacteria bacterium]|nr:superoxide dismutase [Actinomycetota bacterium]
MSAYSLLDLPYGYDALEPFIDARTMELHYTQHHRRYVDQLNAALRTTTRLPSSGERSIDDLLRNIGKVSEESLATAHMGSGWAWLVLVHNRLLVYSLPNEDTPLTAEETPILGLDLWEHAYYLRHQGARADYVEAFWNVVNWKEVGRRFEEATQS